MNTKQNYRNLKKQCGSILRNQTIAFVMAISSILLQTYLIITMQILVDSIVSKNNINQILMKFLLEIVAFSIITFSAQYFFRILTALGKNRVIKALYNNAVKKDISFFIEKDSGQLNSLITNDGEEVAAWIANGWLIRLIQLVSLLINITVLIRYSVILTLIILFFISICFLSVNLIAKKAAIVTEEEFEVKGSITQFLIESFQSINSIKILRKEGYFGSQFNSLINEKKYPLDKKDSVLTALYMSVTIILMQLLPLIAVGIGIILVSRGDMTVGSIVSIYALTGKLQEPVRIIAESLSQEKAVMKLVERLKVLLLDEILDKKTNSIEEFQSLDIDINNFSYDNEHFILNNLNLEITPKQIIVIKGESGKGKSTLVNIIMGIIELKNGSIKVNGLDIKKIDKKSLWEIILLKDQENLIIQGTLNENISFGDKYTDDEIKEVIEVACLEEFVKQYGVNMELAERGKNLSGGQKQRISIARILIRKPKVLILDEPTSALDEDTSNKIVSNIINFVRKNNITLIVISHKSDFDNCSDEIFITK